MNILYITHLTRNKWAGPNYSVPNQIKAQNEYDNVFWYNVNSLLKDKLFENIRCNDLSDYPHTKIKKLPRPFNSPDIVIFEGVYFSPYLKIAKECREMKIPYIIVPRSSLTIQAQRTKKIKKQLGNILYFNRFIKKSTAIQYLTWNEYKDSSNKWNNNYIILPNGIEPKNRLKEFNKISSLRGVFIGRPDIYHKGIDLLLEACIKIKEELINNNCTIELFGPEISNYKTEIQKIIDMNDLNSVIVQKDGIFDEKKEDVLLKSDFFILTSRFEGHPMGLIEALSYGLPSLVTEGTNMANEIDDFKAGWVANNNIESIVEAFRSLFSEKDMLDKKSQNALELSEKYSWSKIGEKTHLEYKKIINS